MVIGIDASRVAKTEKTGTENYAYNLIRALAAVDKKNRYVLYFNKIPSYFEITQPNFSTRVIPAPRFWTQARLAWECFIRPPDVLFVPAHTIPLIRRLKVKTIVTIHDLGAEFLAEYHKFPQKLYLNWSTRYVAEKANALITVSKFTKSSLIKTFSVPSEKIAVVYEGVDRSVFYPREKAEIDLLKAKYGLTRKYFLYVGTVQPRKNLVRLIEAFARSKPKDFDLVVAGTAGWLFEQIYEAPKKFGIEDSVRFLDYVPLEHLPGLYSGATALAFPSLYEGFGLPVIEAFAAGTPVLTSKIGAMAEIAGRAALIVDPLKVEEIAAGLVKIANDESLRLDLIDRGLERAKLFDWGKCAKETVEVFEKVFSGSKL